MDLNYIFPIIVIFLLVIAIFVFNKKEHLDNSTPTNCLPPTGEGWSKNGIFNSPCCQPPENKLYDTSYKTCSNFAQESDPVIQKCLSDCCKYVSQEAKSYDPSWAGVSACGCSVCCYNSKNPHFAKYGDCRLYLAADPAERNAPDDDNYIHFTASNNKYSTYN